MTARPSLTRAARKRRKRRKRHQHKWVYQIFPFICANVVESEKTCVKGENMTTKVHIINFGPDVVSVTKSGVNSDQPSETVYPQGSVDCYVYNGQDLLVKECKPPATVGPNENAKGV